MWLTTLALLATPQFENAQLASKDRTERKQAERRLRRRERSDRCSRIAFRPLFAFGDSRLRSNHHCSTELFGYEQEMLIS